MERISAEVKEDLNVFEIIKEMLKVAHEEERILDTSIWVSNVLATMIHLAAGEKPSVDIDALPSYKRLARKMLNRLLEEFPEITLDRLRAVAQAVGNEGIDILRPNKPKNN